MDRFITYFSVLKWLIFVCIVLVILFDGCGYINKKFGLEDDNPFEQGIEQVIENQTGIEIDLSPNS